jgi:hypothetical protein
MLVFTADKDLVVTSCSTAGSQVSTGGWQRRDAGVALCDRGFFLISARCRMTTSPFGVPGQRFVNASPQR